jgi:hypothetical protein
MSAFTSDITAEAAHEIWITAEKVKRVADKLIDLGPFSIGLDGMLSFVPVVGTVFSIGAGGWLIVQGFRANASALTLARMGFYVGFRTAVSIWPVEGYLVDLLFRGHMFAANALQRDIERRFGLPAEADIRRARQAPFSAPEVYPAR